jgi:gluconate kinase
MPNEMKQKLTKISEAMQKIEDAARSEIDNTEDYMLVCSALMAVTRNMYVETLGPADTIQMFEAVADSIMATEEMIKEFGRDYPKPTIH